LYVSFIVIGVEEAGMDASVSGKLKLLGEFFEFINKLFRSFRWRSPSSRVVRICPRCGSPDIHLSSKFDVWLTPEQYVCRRCGYKGPIILEIEEDECVETDSKSEFPQDSEG